MDKPSATRRVVLPTGIEIREGETGQRLRVTFTWMGKRRRETLKVPVTPANIKYAVNLRASIHNAIERGTFDYAEFFPSSKAAKKASAPVKDRLTVGALIDAYICTARQSKTLSPSTLASYDRWSNARLKPQWGDRYADEVQTTELRTWISELVGSLETKSVRNCVGLLSAVLSRAAADSAIPSNPLAPIKLKSVLPKNTKDDDEAVDPFNDSEISAILKCCRTPEERALWQFAFSTGLRTGELIALKWGNIDPIRGNIRVDENVVSAATGTVTKKPKTDKARDVPMLPAARAAIELIRPISGDVDYVFVNPKTGRRWLDDQQMRKGSWTQTLVRAEVRYRNPYQTRHTFASRLLMSGEAELLVAHILGHETVEMVRRHYGRYITPPEGIKMTGNYDLAFGADSGHLGQDKTSLKLLVVPGVKS